MKNSKPKVGWHHTYVEEYVSLTDDEKKLIKLFFDTEKAEDVKSLVKLLTLDDFFQTEVFMSK